MILRPSDLPDFENPPVVETVLSLQFDRLMAARSAHFGLYWGEIREGFPITEERGELPSIFEREQELPQAMIGIHLEAMEAPPIPRFWFANRAGSELIQVQRDRFIKNWRKAGEGDKYPRYEHVRQGFERDFANFGRFISRNDLGSIRINQCEVTYINHIVAGTGWDTHAELDKVFRVWQQPSTAFPGPAQDLALRTRFPITDSDGRFVGRLHASLQSAFRATDRVPMFVLELTARGQIGEETDFFDLGRKWIVKSFKELTTPSMHSIWKIRS